MKSRKKLICLAVAASLVMGAAFTGCTSTNNEADVKQTVAVVNISKEDKFTEEFGEEYKAAVTDKVFLKRDMMSAYYNGYYQYVQYGQSYAEVFETIKDSLVSNAVTTQYATVYMLKSLGATALSEYVSKTTEAERYEYLLDEIDKVNHSDGEVYVKSVDIARYSMNVTLNSVLDSAERSFLDDEKDDDEYVGSGTRATPTGIDATEDEYIPEDYFVYTGYGDYLIPEGYADKELKEGDYEPLYGTTKVTRRKAYASFLASLKGNYLLNAEDTETTDIWKLSYVRESYVSQLQSQVISVFQDKIKESQEEKLKDIEDGEYSYVKKQYDLLLEAQKSANGSASSFETAMGSLADTTFVLYSPSTESDTEYDEETQAFGTFGYVYNILLPFSTVQEAQLSVLQSYRNNDIYTESQYYYERNKLLQNIKTTDQRSAWFNGTTDYSFDASETELDYYGKKDGRNYLFFENNMTDTEHAQYKALEKYTGLYTYNGTVKKNTDGSYTLIPKKLTIDDMLEEFSAYINHVLGYTATEYNITPNYYKTEEFTVEGEEKEINYKLLVYATGSVNFDDEDTDRKDMFITDKENQTDRYKAMCAVNELQYAYTTDTGVLSQYIGYTVSAYDTSYIKEFEYAAQQAVRKGAGTFAVCAGDYGWHLIYVTETFDTAGDYDADGGSEVYKGVKFSEERVKIEGSFENRFYNWIKDSHLAKEVTLKNNTVLKEYNTERTVTVYTDAYKDLSGL